MFIKEIKESNLIDGVKLITLDTYEDSRGHIATVFSKSNLYPDFVEDKITISYKNVLRGLHGDPHTDKLISCFYGQIELYVIDYRKESDTYGKSEKFVLSDNKLQTVFVPKGCLNGHLCLSDKCIFWYKWSAKYDGPSSQETILWNDKNLNLNWSTTEPILSERDANANPFNYKQIK